MEKGNDRDAVGPDPVKQAIAEYKNLPNGRPSYLGDDSTTLGEGRQSIGTVERSSRDRSGPLGRLGRDIRESFIERIQGWSRPDYSAPRIHRRSSS